MAFQEIEFMKPLRDFLMSYPGLNAGESLSIDYLAIDPSNPGRPQGEALSFVGSSIVRRQRDVCGDTTLSEQANLMLILRRYTQENEYRRDIGDFLFNYTRWVNYEQGQRGTPDESPLLPHFSDTNQEVIRADGGMMTATEVEPGIDEFRIQLHLEYQTEYLT